MVHDLGMLDSWSNRRYVCVFKRHFQSVEYGTIGFIANAVDTLVPRPIESADEGKHTIGVQYIPLATHP